MDIGVYEPLREYRDKHREAFARNAREMFDELLVKSGVDKAANAKTVSEKNALEASRAQLELKLLAVRIATWGLWTFAAFAVWYAISNFMDWRDGAGAFASWIRILLWLSGAAGAIVFGIKAGLPRIDSLKLSIAKLDGEIAEKEQEAWLQMAPLNALFDWDVVSKLIEKTVPRIAMDRRFVAGRLDDLHNEYGWDDSFNNDKSVLFAQSGEINGNPFVIAETLNRTDGEATYKGELRIEWREKVRNSNGRGWHWETKRETLHASVTKFKPEYGVGKYLIYGCTAAPNLTFSRTPSLLSSMGNGMFAQMCKNMSKKSLERKSRNMDGSFTMVANDDFEVLFHADDRNNEREFRLLFTPLAQEQMVRLLKDKEVAWGDDFTFEKRNKYNIITAEHLDETDINTDPNRYINFDLEVVRENFVSFTTAFFKSFYFAMAPLLTIPLYQQTRSHDDIWRTSFKKRSCFWEYESMANYQGEDVFRHPASVTRNLLSTKVTEECGERCTVEVTAHGYEGVKRIDLVPVRGGDGAMHDVPVEWIEYVPVQRTTPMVVMERDGLSLQEFRQAAADGAFSAEAAQGIWSGRHDRYFRRAMMAFVRQPLNT